MAAKKRTKTKPVNIQTVEHSKCTGCGACYNACPVKAISMVEDTEGFLFPIISDNVCTDCGLCGRVCPAINPAKLGYDNPECYAVMAKDEIRWVTSSGGMFVLCADWVLEQGGYVCGAEFTEDWRGVRHAVINSWEQLPKLMRSKYVQSDTNTVFAQIKDKLDNTDKPVLFCGCPCQVAGLYGYLGGDRDNLYTLDLVCHGVPSPKAYRAFIDDIWEVKLSTGVPSDVNFRPKTNGWAYSVSVHLSIKMKDGSERFYEEKRSGPWFTSFLNGFSIRNSCYNCDYSKIPRIGNITIGDFWDVGDIDINLDDKGGTSCVLINNQKGTLLFRMISDRFILSRSLPYEKAVKKNAQLRVRPYKNPMRGCFFSHLDKHGFNKALKYAKKEIMDIGLVCWWYIVNYGSTITSYALYKFLQNHNFSVAMITNPDRPKYYPVEESNVLPFARKHYRITNYRSPAELVDLNHYFDTFILGSDQLWNYYCDYTHFYTLSFADNTKKKIAYSTSFGHNQLFFPQSLRHEVAYHMQQIDKVSVRELDGIDLANELGVSAEFMCDPVFLLDQSEYVSLASTAERKTAEPFILAYIMDPTDGKKDALGYLTKKACLKNVTIPDRQMNYEEKVAALEEYNVLHDAKIEEWLWHLINADFVFVDSFHGLCFAIMFEKRFVCCGNITRGNTRFETMLSRLGLLDRFYYDASLIIDEEHLLEPIDYSVINDVIHKDRKSGRDWLIDAINEEKHGSLTEFNLMKKEIDNLKIRLYELEKKLK